MKITWTKTVKIKLNLLKTLNKDQNCSLLEKKNRKKVISKITSKQIKVNNSPFQYPWRFIRPVRETDHNRRKTKGKSKSQRWEKPTHHQSMTICSLRTFTLKSARLNAIMKSLGIHFHQLFHFIYPIDYLHQFVVYVVNYVRTVMKLFLKLG